MITLKEEFVGGDKWKRAVALGGSDAIVLWLAMKRYAAEHLTNGFVPNEELATLPGAPAKITKALKALCDCGRMRPDGSRGPGLVDPAGTPGWQLHDYLDHANSAEQELERRRKERDRKAAYRSGRKGQVGDDGTCPTGTTYGTDEGTGTGTTNGTGSGVPAPPRAYARVPTPAHPSPASEREDPPTPKPIPRDPMGESLRGVGSHLRADVLRVHAAWQSRFGLTGHKFRGFGDLDAAAVAQAIDLHDEATCLRVLEFAPKDGMVSGRDDEKRVKHDSLRYIFGNAQAFARILRAADEQAPANRESTVQRIARLKQQDPGAGAA